MFGISLTKRYTDFGSLKWAESMCIYLVLE